MRSGGSGDREVELRAGERVLEAEPVGMQELALEAQVAGDAVDGIAADGKPDRLQMDADLVRPPRLEPHLEERARPDELLHLEPRDRVPGRLGVERTARSVAAVTADRRLDPAGSGTRRAQDEREVAPLDPSLANRVREPHVRVVGARDDEQPGRVAVEAVDEPRPLGVSTRRSEREQTVRERRSTVRSGGMRDEARRLVDDEQVLVLVHDVEPELDRNEHPCRRKRDLDLLAAREPMALRTRPPVDEHVARSHEALGERTCPNLGEVRDDRVQPPARVGVRNAKAVRCQRRRSSGRPPRTRGTGGRRRPR